MIIIEDKVMATTEPLSVKPGEAYAFSVTGITAAGGDCKLQFEDSAGWHDVPGSLQTADWADIIYPTTKNLRFVSSVAGYILNVTKRQA